MASGLVTPHPFRCNPGPGAPPGAAGERGGPAGTGRQELSEKGRRREGAGALRDQQALARVVLQPDPAQPHPLLGAWSLRMERSPQGSTRARAGRSLRARRSLRSAQSGTEPGARGAFPAAPPGSGREARPRRAPGPASEERPRVPEPAGAIRRPCRPSEGVRARSPLSPSSAPATRPLSSRGHTRLCAPRNAP